MAGQLDGPHHQAVTVNFDTAEDDAVVRKSEGGRERKRKERKRRERENE